MYKTNSKHALAKIYVVFALATGLAIFVVADALAQPPANASLKDQAGQPPPPSDRNAHKTADLLSTLKLNAQQTTSIKTILDADRAAFEELRQAMRTKSDALQVATKQKLAKILNAEQLGRYEEFKRANRPPRPQGEPPRRDEK